MDSKSLLKMAAEKLDPNDIATLLGESKLAFSAQGQWWRYNQPTGHFKSETGGMGGFGLGEITGVKLLSADELKGFGWPQAQMSNKPGITNPSSHPVNSVKDAAGAPLRPPEPVPASTTATGQTIKK